MRLVVKLGYEYYMMKERASVDDLMRVIDSLEPAEFECDPRDGDYKYFVDSEGNKKIVLEFLEDSRVVNNSFHNVQQEYKAEKDEENPHPYPETFEEDPGVLNDIDA